MLTIMQADTQMQTVTMLLQQNSNLDEYKKRLAQTTKYLTTHEELLKTKLISLYNKHPKWERALHILTSTHKKEKLNRYMSLTLLEIVFSKTIAHRNAYESCLNSRGKRCFDAFKRRTSFKYNCKFSKINIITNIAQMRFIAYCVKLGMYDMLIRNAKTIRLLNRTRKRKRKEITDSSRPDFTKNNILKSALFHNMLLSKSLPFVTTVSSYDA